MSINEIATRADIQAMQAALLAEIASLRAEVQAVKTSSPEKYVTFAQALRLSPWSSSASLYKRIRQRGIRKNTEGLYLLADIEKLWK